MKKYLHLGYLLVFCFLTFSINAQVGNLSENFNSPGLPSGWVTQFSGPGIVDKWTVDPSAYAGSSPAELVCTFQNFSPANGVTRVITPPINTIGVSGMTLNFKHMFSNYSSGATIRVQSSNDLVNWTNEAWSFATNLSINIGPETINTTILNHLNSSTTYIAFVVEGDLYQFNNWYVDDVLINAITTCAGTPNPGNSISTQASVCPGADFILSLQNTIIENGIIYQWQSSPDNSSWTDISGAVNPTFTASQASSTYYRCLVTCTANSSSVIADYVYVTMNGPTSCYCIPPVSFFPCNYMWISEISTSGGISDFSNNSSCAGLSYTDYDSSFNASNIQLGNTTITFGSAGYPLAFTVWIDFNDNGIFDGSERVITNTNYGGLYSFTDNFTVPVSAAPGTHKMRVRGDYYLNGAPADPCGQIEYGETEDYSFTVLSQQFCVPNTSPYACGYMWINNVSTSGGTSDFNNSTGCSGTSYSDFSGSHIAANLQLANTTLTLSSTGYPLSYSVWIDFNHNGSFEYSEQVLANLNSGGAYTVTGSFTIPVTATPGTHKMRIMGDYYGNGAVPSDPCASLVYGETEDYDFTVISVTPCTGTPNPGNTVSSANSVCPDEIFNLGMQNSNFETGISTQWQSSPDNSSWTDISGETNRNLTISQTTATYYRCMVTCSAGPSTTFSNPVLVTMNSITACYCVPPVSYYPTCALWISNVSTNGGISNFNNNSACAGSSFADFSATNNVSNFQLASTSITFNSDGYPLAYGVWIDFNDNGIFDASEQVIANDNSSVEMSVTANFMVPASAAPGTHRMRVRADYKYNGIPMDPCNQLTEGETEDYSFTVVPLSNCVPPQSVYACSDMWLTDVSTAGGVSDFSNSSNCSGSSYSFYGNYKEASNLQLASTSMTFNSANYPMAYSVWIDFDDNDNFDVSERVIANDNTGQEYTIIDSFVVPMNAPPGKHRLRVRAEYFGFGGAPADPCSQLYYGETEDYAFIVIPNIYVSQVNVSSDGNASTIDVEAGTLQMFASVLPVNASNQSVKWSVEDGTGRATISSDGLLTAFVDGTVTVTATAKDGTLVSSSMLITINNQVLTPDDYNILKDGGFATDGPVTDVSSPNNDPWRIWSGNGGTASVIGGVCTMYPAAVSDVWQLQVNQIDWSVTNGQSYSLTFTAWADANRTFVIDMEDLNNNYKRIGNSANPEALNGRSEWLVPLTTTPTTFTFHTTIDSVRMNTKFLFNIMTSGALDVVYIDNITLENEIFQPAGITLQPISNGGFWSSGSQQNIEWTSVNVNQNVNLEYSSDGGNTWSVIANVTPVNGFNSYLWTVPNGDGQNNSMLKVISDDQTLFGTSSLFAIGSAIIMNNDPLTTCSGQFFDSGGEFGPYNVNEVFTKTFSPATAGNKMSFNFSSFNSEYGYDVLYVYDGPDTSSPEIAGSPFTGSSFVSSFTASAQNTSGAITFMFVSDYSIQGTGWAASIACVAGPVAPMISTVPVTSITESSAVTGGDVTADGGDAIVSKGVCWNTTGSPTIADAYTNDGSGLGPFTSYLILLDQNTTYFVRSYATNSQGTFYGDEVSFTTATLDPATQIFSLIGSALYYGDGVTQSNWDYDVDLSYQGTAGNISTYMVNNLALIQNGEFKVRKNYNWNYPSYGYDEITILDDVSNFEKDLITGFGNIKTLTTKIYTVNLIVDWSSNTYSLQLTALSPSFSTTAVVDVSSIYAHVSAEVVNEGFTPVDQFGVCWSTSPDPNLDAIQYTVDGAGLGSYTSYITGLNPNTTYYVKAYTICNSLGVFFGNELSFTTMSADASVSSIVYNVDQNALTISEVALTETLDNFKANISPALYGSFEVYESDGYTIASDLQTGYLLVGMAEDGFSSQNYTIIVNATLSSQAQILAFSAAGIDAAINGVVFTVTANLPLGNDITNLVSLFSVSSGATARVSGSTQLSGLNSQDYTNQVIFEITAEDGTVVNWTVNLSVVQASNDATLSSANYTIDNNSETITNVPGTEALAVFKTNLTPASYASFEVYESDGFTVASDLQSGYLIIVIAQDGTSKTYTVTLNPIGNNQANILSFKLSGINGTIVNATQTVTLTMPYGTDVTNLVAIFSISGGASADVGGTTQISAVNTNDFTNPVVYTITAQNGVNVVNWTVTVNVTPASTDATLSSVAYGVSNAAGTIFNIPNSEPLATFINNLIPATNATFVVYQSDGFTVASDLQTGYKVVVTAEDGITFKIYTVSASGANFITYNIAGVNATVSAATHKVIATLPFGTNVTNLVASFSISGGATARIAGSAQISNVSANNFTNPVVYDITAEDNTTVVNWTVTIIVTAPSTDASLSSVVYSINNTTEIILNVPNTETLSNFKSNLTPAAGATFEVYQNNGTTVATDLQTGYKVKVIAQDGTTSKTYLIASSSANFITYSIAGVNGSINSTTHTISLSMPFGTNVTNLAAIFSISSGASVKVGVTDQVSGVTMNNFTSFVDYKITAQNGTTNVSWKVVVTVNPPSTDASVSSLIYNVNNSDKTITNVPLTESLAVFKSNLTPATGGTFQVYQSDGTTVATDLQTGYKLTGTAQDNSTTLSYSITINSVESNDANFVSFKIAGFDASISTPDIHTVTATLPFGTSISNTAAIYTSSAGVSSVMIGVVAQTSGVTTNNFTNPVVYSLTAEDGTVLTWTVTVTVTPASTDATVSSVDFAVDNAAGTIASVPITESLVTFKGKLTPATFASFEVYESDGSTVAADLQNGYKVIVTAQDVSVTKTYTIITTSAGNATASNSLICSGDNSSLTLSGFSGTIQWEQSPDGLTSWLNVSGGTGATTASYTTANLTSTTYYRAAVDFNSTVSHSNVLTVAIAQIPADAAAISGPDTICIAQQVGYFVPVIANATSYVWTLPGIANVIGSDSNNDITLEFGNGFTIGSVQVFGRNTCFDGNPSIMLVRSNPLPGDAGTITGPAAVCQGEDSVIFTVPTITNATSYIWELPGGAGGESSISHIDVAFGASAVNGDIIVKGNNICGVGTPSTLALSVSQLPAGAGPINIGKAAVCQGETSITYGGSSVARATSYVWTLPEGATGVITDNLITIDYSNTAVSGNLIWQGHNSCGDGAPGSLAIVVSPLPVSAGTISGLDTICQSQDGIVYRVPAVANATSYVWTVPTSASIVGASTADSITVNYNISFASGNINVIGSNRCGSGTASVLAIVVRPFPDNAGTITGPVAVCQGEVLKNYTVPAIANASSYAWTLPDGMTGTSTTNSINVDFDVLAESGFISVAGENKCYLGTGSDIEVSVNPVPANPGVILGPEAVCPGSTAVIYRVNPNLSTIPASGYIWTLPNGVTGTSPTRTIIVDFGPDAISSTISVKGHNTCDGPTSSLDVQIYAPFPNELICLVTIDLETGKNMIVWEKTNGVRTASYNIYRQGNIVNQYDSIGNILFDDLSVFVDMNSFPEQQQYKYKISAIDSCGNESTKSLWHKTMLLQYTPSTNGVPLSWEEYATEAGAINFDSWIILRGTDSTALDSLTTLSSDLFAYTDKSPEAISQKMFYRVGGVKHDPCDPADLITGKKASSGPFVHSLSNLEDNRLQKANSIGNNLVDALRISIYPSPFTEQTNINYTLEKQTRMKVEVYNVVGEKIKILLDENQSSGAHKIEMKASDVNYQPGVYYIKIYVDDEVVIRKTMMTR